MGGDALAAGGVEYGFPLFGDVLRGAAFVDSGNVGFNTGELRRNWRVTWGLGILVKVPFFGSVPLRFDFAWPLKEAGGDERQTVSFEFSTFF
jgi:outer membrane protein insertion porin family